MHQYRLIATCPEEVKEALMLELENLGYAQIEAGYKAVYFQADSEEDFYKAPLYLRTASQVFWFIKTCPGQNALILEKQSERVAWEKYLPPQATYLINGIQTARGSEYMSANDISKAVRLGLEARFKRLALTIPKVDLKEPDLIINAFWRENKCTLSINISGMALHKRGYRSISRHPAPIKETLAASLLHLVGYTGQQTLIDAMTGSGTFAIEAAGIALNKAALIHRPSKNFAFTKLATFNNQTWRKVQDHARLEKHGNLSHPIIANDIDERWVNEAKDHALRARVERYIDFSHKDILAVSPPSASGILIANLPYGERIKEGSSESLETLYRSIGFHLKHHFKSWRIGLLAAEDSPYRMIGLRPNRKFKFLNGDIPVVFLIFDILPEKAKLH